MTWEKAKLGDICTIKKGSIGIMKAIPGDYPLVVLGEERKSHNEYQFDDEAVIIPLVSSTGHGHASMKRIFFQKGKFSVGSILCAVIPKDKSRLSAEFLYRYLDFNKEKELVSRMKGMANVSLPMKEIASVEIPLPPIEHQKKLIEEFQILETAHTQITNELSDQLELVSKLRQAYLREAMQGKLVPQDDVDEPAEALLERINAEKEKLVAAKKIKRDKPLSPINGEEIPFEIPSNWAWCRLGDIGLNFRRGPFGSALRKDIFVKDGYKVYEQRNAIYDNPTLGNYFITEKKFKELEAFSLKPNDLIISCSGVTLGKIAEIPEGSKEGVINQALLRVRLFEESMLNRFFIKLFRSPYLQKRIFEEAWGTAIPNMVGLGELKKILIPLPPLAEQERIVAKLEKLMKFCDELEANIREGRAQAETLLQVALKEALEPK